MVAAPSNPGSIAKSQLLSGHEVTGLPQRSNYLPMVDARQLGQGYTSTVACLAPADRASSWAASKYPRMASAMFTNASASVVPCE